VSYGGAVAYLSGYAVRARSSVVRQMSELTVGIVAQSIAVGASGVREINLELEFGAVAQSRPELASDDTDEVELFFEVLTWPQSDVKAKVVAASQSAPGASEVSFGVTHQGGFPFVAAPITHFRIRPARDTAAGSGDGVNILSLGIEGVVTPSGAKAEVLNHCYANGDQSAPLLKMECQVSRAIIWARPSSIERASAQPTLTGSFFLGPAASAGHIQGKGSGPAMCGLSTFGVKSNALNSRGVSTGAKYSKLGFWVPDCDSRLWSVQPARVLFDGHAYEVAASMGDEQSPAMNPAVAPPVGTSTLVNTLYDATLVLESGGLR
jgi:hypothetical protein